MSRVATVAWRPDCGARGRWQYEVREAGMLCTGWLDLPQDATDDQLRSGIREYEFGFDGPVVRVSWTTKRAADSDDEAIVIVRTARQARELAREIIKLDTHRTSEQERKARCGDTLARLVLDEDMTSDDAIRSPADEPRAERPQAIRAQFEAWVAEKYAGKGRGIEPVVREAMANAYRRGWLDAPDPSEAEVEAPSYGPAPCNHRNAQGLMVGHPLGDGAVASCWSWCPDCGAISSDGAPWQVPRGGR